jgi:GT2 family glycosyltransferase
MNKKDENISLSVIIPTYYRYKYLSDLLDMLSKQTFKKFEVIVPDQTPEADRPTDFYKKFHKEINLEVIYIKEPSLTRPRNIAVEYAKGEILLFLDDDIIIKKNFIESHVDVMKRENVDVVNGATTLKDRLPLEYPWDVRVLDPVRFFLVAPNYKWEGMMFTISSCNVSIKKKNFLAVGGFDEKIPRMVDFELGYRLYKSGAKIYFSYKPLAKHLRGDGGSRKNPKNHNKLVSAIYIHRKHFPGWITTQFILKLFLTRRHYLIFPWKVYFAWRKVGRLLND